MQADRAREELAECPELSNYERFFWRAFMEISTMRPTGMGTYRLRLDTIDYWADRNNLSDLQTDILVRVIRNMDNVWMMGQAKAQKAASKS